MLTMSNVNPQGEPCNDKKKAVRALVEAGIDAIFGGEAAPVAAAPTEPVCTLRYGTLVHTVKMSEVGTRSVADLFEDASAVLGRVEIGENSTIRDTHATEGGVVDHESTPVAGRTYILSIRKEAKGL